MENRNVSEVLIYISMICSPGGGDSWFSFVILYQIINRADLKEHKIFAIT